MVFTIGWIAEPTTNTLDWLTALFSLTTSCDRGVNIGCLPLSEVVLDDSELWLENLEPALRC